MKYSVFDAHCDTLCIMEEQKNGKSHVTAEGMSGYEKYTQVYACFIAPKYYSCAKERAIKLIDTYYQNNLNGILSIEGGECIESAADIERYYSRGVRIAALTWNNTNRIAAGADESDKSKGLTEFGKEIVREMNRIGMIVDVSHLNDKSFYDIAKISTNPIVATHSCSRKICPHRRNITDEMFKIIAESGGVTGINFYPIFLTGCEKAVTDDIVRHIEHFMELGGENSIGIGADYDGVDFLPEGISGCGDTYKVFDRLLQLNYTEEQVEKISCKNFERVMADV